MSDTASTESGPRYRSPEHSMTYCHYCGSLIDTGEWYPVVTTTDDAGAVELYSFCRERCRDCWRVETASR